MKVLSFLILALLLISADSSALQAQVEPGKGVRTAVPTLVNTLTIVPYLTASFNTYSGKAFPASAKGLGFGGGLAFDLTDPGQKVGLLFDFAFQDMRGFAQNGSCVHENDSVLTSANAEHYWQYILFEPFLKFQTASKKGYFLLGASFGFAVQSETVSRGVVATEYTLWEGSDYSNQFRLDLRAGLGVDLAKISNHDLVLEARIGYPLTNVISNYQNACSGGDIGGWKVITLQTNLGLRL